MKSPRRGLVKWAERSAAVGAGVLLGVLLTASCQWAPASKADPGEIRVPPPPAPHASAPRRASLHSMGTFESPFVRVAEMVKPAVVNVNTRKRFEHPPIGGDVREDLLREFFPDMPQEEFDFPSSASGFVIDEEGHVITNNHVIQNAEQIDIQFVDGGQYSAEVVGVDPSTDVAVIRIVGGGPFPSVLFGNSDSVRVGDWAVAVGNPFGYLEGSVTVGVVSAKGRTDLDIMGGGPVYQNFIQTDASINFGNSGGPLVNIRGEVIGVNTAINASGQGIGFAIPINLAKEIAQELISTGKVTRAYLGVYPQALTPEIVEGKRLRATEGILVGQVMPDTPAEAAGIERGDVILSFAGIPVTGVSQFRMLVAESEIGAALPVLVERDGEEKEVRVRLVERPDVLAEAPEEEERDLWLGIEVIDPEEEPEVAGRLGVEGLSGVLVSVVERGSSAWDAGIRPGDFIREINDREIEDLDDYQEAERESRSREKPVIFLILRDGFTSYVAVEP